MAYEIIIKKRFVNKLLKTLHYLENEWSHKVASDFLLKIDGRIEQLSKQPFIGAPSEKIKNVRGIFVTRHNRLYYKIVAEKVIILNLYDTRTNSKKKIY